MKNLAQSIPAKYRTVIYSIIGVLSGLSAALKLPFIASQLPVGVVDVTNTAVAAVVAVAAALGFTVAVANVPGKYDY